VASRKEQKEALRREREAREREAHERDRRRRLVGYGAGGVLALAALVAVVVVLVAGGGGGGGGGGGKPNPNVLPSGGHVPAAKISDLSAAAKAAGCQLEKFKATSRNHVTDIHAKIHYSSNPPTSGSHYQVPADDGAYSTSPPVDQLVHNLEHGRIVIWFKPSLPRAARASLLAFFNEDTYQMVLTPHPDMSYELAASAWGADPTPDGTGYLMGCKRYSPKVFDALRAFREEHRGKGPEPVP
jgi:Protein of unknown function (DUF3105)